jgi:hypothetical protein
MLGVVAGGVEGVSRWMREGRRAGGEERLEEGRYHIMTEFTLDWKMRGKLLSMWKEGREAGRLEEIGIYKDNLKVSVEDGSEYVSEQWKEDGVDKMKNSHSSDGIR